MDEYKYASYIKEILNKKIHDNKNILTEKEKAIIESLDSFYQDKSETKDYGDKLHMLDEINYARSISDIANRQLSRYILMLDRPYFGRLDFKNEWGELSYYFGIESLIDNEDIVVYDWRSPIANLYYDSIMGKASYESPNGVIDGELTLKRQYKFKNGELIYYSDMISNISDELLFDTLKNSNDMVMKNIVATIQKEQNKVIRYLDNKNVLVLGVAGSGKTSIALHRIAYLMYKDSLKYDSNKVCFITPNNIFFKYIDNVLPELGEDNVINLTLNQIAQIMLRAELYKLKLKLESKEEYFERVIENELVIDYENIFNNLNEFLNIKISELFNAKIGLKLKELTFSNALFKELYFNKFSRRNYYKRKKMIKEFILDRLSINNKLSMEIIKTVDTFMDKLLPEINYFDLYNEFINRYNYDKNIISKGILKYENIYPLIYIRLFFKDSTLFDKYNHLLVDEYQDLNVIERSVIDKLFNCSKTYLGDRNQSLFIQKSFKDSFNGDVISLNNSYRSSKQIFDFLNRIIKNNGVNTVNREGKNVEIIEFDSDKEMLEKLISEIKEYNGKSLGIVTKSYKEAKKVYENIKNRCNVNILTFKGKDIKRGIVIGSLYLTKGLEFEKVIVLDASEKKYKKEIDRNYLYIACSRAMHELSLYSVGKLSELIDK